MNTCIVLVFLDVCECNALELCESDHVGAAFKFINHYITKMLLFKIEIESIYPVP